MEEFTKVGWLELQDEFETAEPSAELLDRLWLFAEVSVRQARGFHECEFCLREGVIEPNRPIYVSRNGIQLQLGSAQLFVFGRSGEIYNAPNLIYHYVERHKYRLPSSFEESVFHGLEPQSDEYYSRLEDLRLSFWPCIGLPSDSGRHNEKLKEEVRNGLMEARRRGRMAK